MDWHARGWAKFFSIIIALAMLLFGCSSSSTQTTIIHVADAQTNEDIENAAITVRPMSFFVPAYPYDHLSPSTPNAVKTLSGPNGTAILDIPSGQPSQLLVFHPEFQPFRALIEPLEPPRDWKITGRSNEDQFRGRTIRVRVRSSDTE